MIFSAIWKHITTNNLIPYLAIIGMGFIIYFLWQSNIKKDLEIEQQKANVESLTEAFAIQSAYSNEQNDKMQKAMNSKFKEGMYRETLTYTIDNNN